MFKYESQSVRVPFSLINFISPLAGNTDTKSQKVYSLTQLIKESKQRLWPPNLENKTNANADPNVKKVICG